MEWLEDIVRWLGEIVTNEQVVHLLKHMTIESFKHFVKYNLPHIWSAFGQYIGEIFRFVQDWFSGS